MGGKFDKTSAIGGSTNYDEQPGKFYGLEQSLSFLSKNVSKNMTPAPNFNKLKNRNPIWSIPRSERFPDLKAKESEDEKAMEYLGSIMDHLNEQQNSSEVKINNDPKKVF